MLKLYKIIAGLNGRINFITKRDKNSNKKRYIFFIEVPITRNIDQLKSLIASRKYDRLSRNSKIVLEPLNNGTTIHILKGILIEDRITKDTYSSIFFILSKILELIKETK